MCNYAYFSQSIHLKVYSKKLNKSKYESIGFITKDDIHISFNDVLNDFYKIFNETSTTKLEIIKVLNKYVPDFNHIETGKNLDQKM